MLVIDEGQIKLECLEPRSTYCLICSNNFNQEVVGINTRAADGDVYASVERELLQKLEKYLV